MRQSNNHLTLEGKPNNIIKPVAQFQHLSES